MSWIPSKVATSAWYADHTPIDMLGTTGLVMCKLDFKTYSTHPYTYPMFKDLVSLSKCDEKLNVAISVLKKNIVACAGTPEGRIVYPNALIFHESRVGSTLVANMLASDDKNMVFSEVYIFMRHI